MAESNGEARLVDPLLEWLQQRRRLRVDTIILHEFPWYGRRIDLVTLTCSGTATAYELKLNNNRRAIQQAGYNKLVFHRSYVVTLSEPTMENLKHARDFGVGFIVFVNGEKIPYSSDNGYVYDIESNSIVFTGSAIPTNGATIDVSYNEETD